jgi:hypothetical protein
MTGVEERMFQFIGHSFALALNSFKTVSAECVPRYPSDHAKSSRSKERRTVGRSFLLIRSNIDLKGDSSDADEIRRCIGRDPDSERRSFTFHQLARI